MGNFSAPLVLLFLLKPVSLEANLGTSLPSEGGGMLVVGPDAGLVLRFGTRVPCSEHFISVFQVIHWLGIHSTLLRNRRLDRHQKSRSVTSPGSQRFLHTGSRAEGRHRLQRFPRI